VCRYWQGELFSRWNPSDEAISVYSRSFAQAVAGTPTSMTFDPQSAQFQLCYVVDPTIIAPTEIYGNFKVHYPNGVDVAVTGAAAESISVEVDAANNMIYARYTLPTSPKSGGNDCCVIVTKK
jgi:hypothetical protein